MNSESKPRSSTVLANDLIPRARSGPSPSQTYEGRNTPNRPTSLTCRSPCASASPAVVGRRALLEEGPSSFEEVVGREDPDRRLDLGLVAVSQRAIEGAVDEG